tara:strand:+ start:210 stop:899 length:690 start_codon:yes stop_codon:yes gene_type:complete
MKDKNLRIWNEVSTSNPDHLKPLNFGRKITTINAQSQRLVATTLFGPMGIGWGVDNEGFREVTFNNSLWLIYTAKLWYKDPVTEKIGEISLASDIQFKSDAIKSVATDALTKGLSQLGFNADVFLGDWDDNKYANQNKTKGGGFPSALPPIKSGSSLPKSSNAHKDSKPSSDSNDWRATCPGFGKHSDKPWKEIPTDYLQWLQNSGTDTSKVDANRELNFRNEEATNGK